MFLQGTIIIISDEEALSLVFKLLLLTVPTVLSKKSFKMYVLVCYMYTFSRSRLLLAALGPKYFEVKILSNEIGEALITR